MKLTFIDVSAAAKGQWRNKIFPAFHITVPKTNKQHGPCPACGKGDDRFRCDDKQGRGTYICNQCGAGDGFDLIAKVRGFTAPEVLQQVAEVVGLTDTSQITEETRAQWKREAELKAKHEAAEKERLQNLASGRAKRTWETSKFTDQPCPYLDKKQVKNYGCKVTATGDLLVPLHDETGKIWNIQTIPATGDKKFMASARVSGCFHFIGAVDLANPIICIAEGYATAASIHEATGHPVAVAFNANNLEKVGIAIARQNPNARLVYCADDDSAKQSTGEICANKAVAATGGIVVMPDFSMLEPI